VAVSHITGEPTLWIVARKDSARPILATSGSVSLVDVRDLGMFIFDSRRILYLFSKRGVVSPLLSFPEGGPFYTFRGVSLNSSIILLYQASSPGGFIKLCNSKGTNKTTNLITIPGKCLFLLLILFPLLFLFLPFFIFPEGGSLELVSLNNLAFFVSTTPKEGSELWRTDGTIKGTWQVPEESVPGPQGSAPDGLKVFGR
jgi:ELWxxDGT repeat protein